MGVIYLRTNLVNGKQYVGQSKNFKEREYSWNCLKCPYGNQLLTKERNDYGLNNFSVEIIKECDDTELDYWEKYFIENLNTIYPNGYNQTEGGSLGFHHSEITKKKISEKNTGNIPYNKGKKIEDIFDEETCSIIRKKISDFAKTRIGEKNSFFGKTFLKPPMLGKHHTEETKLKISKKNKNGKTSIPIIQANDNGNVIKWVSIREASRNGYDCGSISRAVRGEYKKSEHHYKGSMWYFESDYIKMLGETP